MSEKHKYCHSTCENMALKLFHRGSLPRFRSRESEEKTVNIKEKKKRSGESYRTKKERFKLNQKTKYKFRAANIKAV